MSRINTNIPSMIAQRVYAHQNSMLNQSLARLSTGLRINTGKDDPAGLIASEGLRSEKNALNAAITNISRANNIVSVAEGGLVETGNLLTELEDLIDRSANEAGISPSEREANQTQIDAILDSINRIANSTEFQGRKLLSGELAYTTSGVTAGDITGVAINSARLPEGAPRTVVVEVTASAQLAQLTHSGAIGAGGATIEVTGNIGTETMSFASGTSVSSIADAINSSRDTTGVSAYVQSGVVYMTSTGYGSSQFVTVTALNGTFGTAGGDHGTTDFGGDATININGTAATTNGLRASMRNSSLNVDIDLSATFGTTLGTTQFTITGGGADFMIAPRVSAAGIASLGLNSVSTGHLGNSNDGVLASLASGQANQLTSRNYATAQRIVRAAEQQVAFLQGRLGAFQKNTLDTTTESLKVTLENTTAAESTIRDTDFAEETSNLTRSQILVQSATNTLRLANAAPQSVLALLQG